MSGRSEVIPKKKSISKPHKSKAGYLFEFSDNDWRVNGSLKVYFSWLSSLDECTSTGFKQTLCRYAEEASGYHTRGLSIAFKSFMRYLGTETITLQGLIKYRTSLSSDNEHKLGKLKSFLIAWFDWGI